jgi:anti-sigma B factor antagonist
MKILQRKEGEVCILSLEKACYLDNETEEYFADALMKHIKENDKLVVELENIEYINSAGLGALIKIYSACREKGCAFKMANPRPRIAAFFDITKMNTLFDIHPALQEALESF